LITYPQKTTTHERWKERKRAEDKQDKDENKVPDGMVNRDRAESARPLSGKLCSLIVLLVVATTASWAQVMSPNSGSCSTQSVSSIRLGRIHSFWPVSQIYHSSGNTTDALRLERGCRSTTGPGSPVRPGSGSSCSSLLRRYLLAAGNGLVDYVCRLISAEEK
jgi:hypothetical protein